MEQEINDTTRRKKLSPRKMALSGLAGLIAFSIGLHTVEGSNIGAQIGYMMNNPSEIQTFFSAMDTVKRDINGDGRIDAVVIRKDSSVYRFLLNVDGEYEPVYVRITGNEMFFCGKKGFYDLNGQLYSPEGVMDIKLRNV